MVKSKGTLDAAQIRTLLEEVATQAKRKGIRGKLYVVGGAAIALGFRSTRRTEDVDALVMEGGEALKRIISEVGVEAGLSDEWVNEHAALSIPKQHDGKAWTALENEALSVLGASPEHLLAMKIKAHRRKDEQDVHILIENLAITQTEEAEEIYRTVTGVTWSEKERDWTERAVTDVELRRERPYEEGAPTARSRVRSELLRYDPGARMRETDGRHQRIVEALSDERSSASKVWEAVVEGVVTLRERGVAVRQKTNWRDDLHGPWDGTGERDATQRLWTATINAEWNADHAALCASTSRGERRRMARWAVRYGRTAALEKNGPAGKLLADDPESASIIIEESARRIKAGDLFETERARQTIAHLWRPNERRAIEALGRWIGTLVDIEGLNATWNDAICRTTTAQDRRQGLEAEERKSGRSVYERWASAVMESLQGESTLHHLREIEDRPMPESAWVKLTEDALKAMAQGETLGVQAGGRHVVESILQVHPERMDLKEKLSRRMNEEREGYADKDRPHLATLSKRLNREMGTPEEDLQRRDQWERS